MVLILCCFGMVLSMSVGLALACTCAAPLGPVDGLKRSTAVFRGRVSEISQPFWDRIGLTNSGGHRVKFAVIKQWKGTASKSIEVATRLTGEACGFPFEQGIFGLRCDRAQRHSDGNLHRHKKHHGGRAGDKRGRDHVPRQEIVVVFKPPKRISSMI